MLGEKQIKSAKNQERKTKKNLLAYIYLESLKEEVMLIFYLKKNQTFGA